MERASHQFRWGGRRGRTLHCEIESAMDHRRDRGVSVIVKRSDNNKENDGNERDLRALILKRNFCEGPTLL